MGLRQELARRPIIGTFVGLGDPAVVEILGASGFELVCIDTEHAPYGPTEVVSMVRAAEAVGASAIVRVSGIGPEIGRALDSGASGVLVPMVESADQAAQVVQAVRYPPVGRRGAGPGRATAYGIRFADYLGAANDDIAAMIQVESRAGVEAVEEIVATEGLDLVFVGPGDLAVSLGTPGGSPEHRAAVERVVTAARAAGVPVGMFCATADAVTEWSGLGVTFFLVSCDLILLAGAAKSIATVCVEGAKIGAAA